MLSFFAEPALKAAVRHRVAEHRRLDQIAQRVYWQDGRGCFIGCSLHSSNHDDFERLLGLPIWLAYLGERIFEGLPKEEAVEFPLSLYDSIPVGVDLEPVKARFLAWLILDPEHGACRFNDDPRVRAVGEAWEATLRGEKPDWAALFMGVLSDTYAFADDAAAAASAAAAAADDDAAAAAGDAASAAAFAAADDDDADDWMRAAAAKLIQLCASIEAPKEPQPSLPEDPYFLGYYRTVRLEAGV